MIAYLEDGLFGPFGSHIPFSQFFVVLLWLHRMNLALALDS